MKNYNSLLILIFVVISFQSWLLIKGQYAYLGRCLNLPVQANFNVDNYMGTWFMIEQYMNFGSASVCLKSNYSQNENITDTFGNGSFLMTTSHLTPLGWRVERDVAFLEDKSVPAKYLIGSSTSADINYVQYWIMATDYQNYSLVWSCRPLTAFNLQIVRFLSRTRTANRYVRDKVYSKLKRLGINSRILTRSPQIFCPP